MLECAHCGIRAAAGATRCPGCLRATGLVEIEVDAARPDRAPGSPRQRRVRALVAAGALVAIGASVAGVVVATHAPRGDPTVVSVPGVAPGEAPPPFALGPETTPLVAQVRSATDPLARARAVMDAVAGAMRAAETHPVADPDDVPPARPLDAVYRALRTPGGRVTALDLARLEAAVLRTCGTAADVAERTVALREDEPADPTGLVGSYVVTVGDHAIDVATGALVGAHDARPRALDARALTGAMLAQSALSIVSGDGPRDRLLALANAAVDTWHDGGVPLAVRARVWRVVGASGGSALAGQDLDAAIALRDDAALHLLRARLALVEGDIRAAAAEASVALHRAPAWGSAALAAVVFARGRRTDAGDSCAPLVVPREAWTDDALGLCHAAAAPDDATGHTAARLMATSRDPLRVAFAAAAGADGALARVRGSDRRELAAWFVLLGRGDLARAALGLTDAGT